MLKSPRLTARMAGLFYLLMMLVGGVAAFARRDLIVKNDAAATATAIIAHHSAFTVSFAAEIFVTVFYLVVVALLYRLLKPVNPSLALADAFLGLTGCIVQACATAFMIAPFVVLGGADYLNVFRTDQLQAISYMFLRLYSQTYGIAIIFFALYCLIAGYMIYRSTFLPRIVGVLLMIAGAAWLTFLSPTFGAAYLRPYIMPFAIGEAVLTLWLLVKGVDVERWKESALSSV